MIVHHVFGFDLLLLSSISAKVGVGSLRSFLLHYLLEDFLLAFFVHISFFFFLYVGVLDTDLVLDLE
jgi:hypothetical protein